VKTVLITGGAGFIGSRMVKYLFDNYDYNITVLDALTYAGNMGNIPDNIKKDKRFTFWHGNIRSGDLVNELVAKADIVINFAAESISADTYVPIWNNGKIEILTLEDMFNRSAKVSPALCCEGVETIDFQSDNHRVVAYKGGIGYWMKIQQISRHKYQGNIIRLTQKWGEVTVTPNHSIYDCNFDVAYPVDNPELLGMRNINHISKQDRALGFSGERLRALLRVFGSYVPEGWTSFDKANGSFQCGFSNKNEEWLLSTKIDLQLIGFNSSITWRHGKGRASQLVVSSRELFQLLRKHAGYGSHGKMIPSFVFQLKKEFQEEFLARIVTGDGQVVKNQSYETTRYTTVSRKLATGLSLLLTMLKMNYSVSVDKRCHAYCLSFGGDYTESLLEKRYEELDYDGYVYDVSVEHLENFACGVGNVVVHNTHVARSIYDNTLFYETDVLGTQVVTNAVSKHPVERFIHISTSEVYGTALSIPMTEDHPLNPTTPYASAKVGGDRLVYSYWATYNIPAVIVRPFNQFGPNQHLEKVIPRFITSALQDEPLTIHGTGNYTRDWTYVDDTCLALDRVIHADLSKVKGQVINIGTGREISVREIANMVLAELNKPQSLIKHVSGRPGQVNQHISSTDKALRLLDWKAETTFYEGIVKTIKWYRENADWWQGLLWMKQVPTKDRDGKVEYY